MQTGVRVSNTPRPDFFETRLLLTPSGTEGAQHTHTHTHSTQPSPAIRTVYVHRRSNLKPCQLWGAAVGMPTYCAMPSSGSAGCSGSFRGQDAAAMTDVSRKWLLCFFFLPLPTSVHISAHTLTLHPHMGTQWRPTVSGACSSPRRASGRWLVWRTANAVFFGPSCMLIAWPQKCYAAEAAAAGMRQQACSRQGSQGPAGQGRAGQGQGHGHGRPSVWALYQPPTLLRPLGGRTLALAALHTATATFSLHAGIFLGAPSLGRINGSAPSQPHQTRLICRTRRSLLH